MLLEIQTIITVINQIREFLKLSDGERQVEKAEVKSALKAIYTASIETKNYLNKREEGSERDTGIESGLSKLWIEAAIEIRNIDINLARDLEMKSLYWTEPHNWTDEQVKRSGIGIDRITESARELLLNS